ncbi:MAG: dUTP diphosphatase [Candidatus Nanopelagicales bacterium]|nr:dUTP diphosphatase [Candidatus Nanopelagicales bacterium]
MVPVHVLIQRLDSGLPLPAREQPGDAGFDLYATQACRIDPGERLVIPTGVAIALPPGYVGLIHPRSGLAAKHGFTLVNSPGTIDAGYRGEIAVIGLNTGKTSLDIDRGDRVAQLVIQRLPDIALVEVETLPGSVRSAGGFGSTGGFGSAESATTNA